jgi:hypothetical protein
MVSDKQLIDRGFSIISELRSDTVLATRWIKNINNGKTIIIDDLRTLDRNGTSLSVIDSDFNVETYFDSISSIEQVDDALHRVEQ